eukprot:scaffold12553_cov97-Isochrysis_galbana.AAC.2
MSSYTSGLCGGCRACRCSLQAGPLAPVGRWVWVWGRVHRTLVCCAGARRPRDERNDRHAGPAQAKAFGAPARLCRGQEIPPHTPHPVPRAQAVSQSPYPLTLAGPRPGERGGLAGGRHHGRSGRTGCMPRHRRQEGRQGLRRGSRSGSDGSRRAACGWGRGRVDAGDSRRGADARGDLELDARQNVVQQD